MGIKYLVKHGARHDNILVRIYFIGSLLWLGLFLLMEIGFIIGGRQDIRYGVISIGEVIYALVVLMLIGLAPLVPFLLLNIKKLDIEEPEPSDKKQDEKKKEKPQEKPVEEKKEETVSKDSDKSEE